jgi:hypothetical protein
MSDAGEYGVHQHASPGAVRAHTLVGEPSGLVTGNASVVGASPAGFSWSTAPYKKPPPPPRSKLCARDNCRGLAKLDSLYCRHHEPPATA